jgi:hypothetical protein
MGRLLRCAETGHHGRDVGDQQQRVHLQRLGQQRRGEILVHHGLDPAQVTGPLVADDRHAATVGADHEHAGRHEFADQAGLHNPLGLRRRHDPPSGRIVQPRALTSCRPASAGLSVATTCQPPVHSVRCGKVEKVPLGELHICGLV